MLEGIAGPIDIYGNIYLNLRGADGANGINMNSNESSMIAHIYGNTVVQKGGGNNLFNLKGNGSWTCKTTHLRDRRGQCAHRRCGWHQSHDSAQ